MAALHGHGHSMSESGIGRDYITGLYSEPPRRPPPSPPTSSHTLAHSRGTSLPPLVIPNNGSPTPRPLSVFRSHEAPTTGFLNFSLPRPVACRKTSSIYSNASKSTHISMTSTNSTYNENRFLSPSACLVPPPPPKSPRRPSMSGSHQISLPLPTPTQPLSDGSDPARSRPLSSGSDQVPELEPDVHNDDVSSLSDADETPPPPNYAPPSPPSPPSLPPRSPLRPLSMESYHCLTPQLPPPSPKSQLRRSHFYPGKRNPPARINFRLSQGYYHKSSKSTPNLRRQSDDSTGSGESDTITVGKRQPKTYNLDALNRLMSPSDLDMDNPTARDCGKAEADAFSELIGIIDRYNAKEGGPSPVPGRLPRRVSSLNVRVVTPVIDPVEEQRELGKKGLRQLSPAEYAAELEGVWGSYFDEDTPV
ncbi:hypothetical protein QBC45DRAFT_17779 [Copromyces sp. CBS 386.78]|nr:hypothetical protein QBC45DRAFT_17779 [Copromyces sp. CBS 386.78]